MWVIIIIIDIHTIIRSFSYIIILAILMCLQFLFIFIIDGILIFTTRNCATSQWFTMLVVFLLHRTFLETIIMRIILIITIED
ncbi:hypothetical protein BDC45DRAFT_515610 [Circinella umbellata]|nr:hypothetical protein BDC45DRAFT_515610 [Circinella umbellata]